MTQWICHVDLQRHFSNLKLIFYSLCVVVDFDTHIWRPLDRHGAKFIFGLGICYDIFRFWRKKSNYTTLTDRHQDTFLSNTYKLGTSFMSTSVKFTGFFFVQILLLVENWPVDSLQFANTVLFYVFYEMHQRNIWSFTRSGYPVLWVCVITTVYKFCLVLLLQICKGRIFGYCLD